MTEQENKEGQKTVVAFIAGLLIGGLLVWVFSDAPAEQPSDTTETGSTSGEVVETDASSEVTTSDTESDDAADEAVVEVPVLKTGKGAIKVTDQAASSAVAIESAEFPNDEGWVGVRDYTNGQLTGLLGVARFSKEQGLIPEEITLQRATVSGNEYAVVFYTESGDRDFSLADDVQIEGIMETFMVK